MQMPNVFVVPPEEDHSPTWCFFDAAHPALAQLLDRPETPDIHVFSFPNSSDPSPFGTELPVSMDSLISSRKSAETRSVVEALDDGNEGIIYHDFDTDSEYELEGALSSAHNDPLGMLRDAVNDSDVIEVVKVKRSRHIFNDRGPQNVPLNSEFKRSKTFKSRASKAFRSLKGSLRASKPCSQDALASAKSNSYQHSDIVTPTMTNAFPPTPSVSRRGSRILSHLFISPSLKSCSSVSSLDESTHVSESDPTFFASASSPTQSSFVSTSSATDCLSCRLSIYDNEPLQNEAQLKAGSPMPAVTADFKVKNRRFSILSLQKLFSFSSPVPLMPSSPISLTFDDSNCTTPTLRSTSCTPSSITSVCTTSDPQTPTNMEEGSLMHSLPRGRDTGPASFASVLDSNKVLNLDLALKMDNFCARRSSEEHTPRVQRVFCSSTFSKESGTSTSEHPERITSYPVGPGVPQHEPGDLSFEMRLDSLHFDSLSFDADRFFTAN